LTVYWHAVFAACVTVNVLPATVIVPTRCDELVLAATVNVTRALPVPLVAELNVSHDALLCAVQLHPGAAVIFVQPPVPLAGAANEFGVIENEHVPAA
jgi:hypothetical protein